MAYAQGLLSKPSLNFAQTWALQYALYLERRIKLDDKKDELELQVYHLSYDRWEQLYKNKGGDVGEAFGGEPELPVTDPRDLDEWYGNIDQPRSISAAAALGYADGPGRLV